MNIKGLDFKSEGGYLENYSVFDKNGKMVGYVQLVWNSLLCSYPHIGGEEIYREHIHNIPSSNFFKDKAQRMHYLNIIADKIIEKTQTTRKNVKRVKLKKWKYDKIQTNGNKIRDMSDEELAVWLCSKFDNCSPSTCPGANYCNGTDGKANGLVKWLKQPVEE